MSLRKNKIKNSRGFTISEVLIAVAVLAVLAAVAVPAIFSVRQNMRMRRLNDTAREIYLTAQSELTGRQAAGTAENIGGVQEGAEDCYWLSSIGDGAENLIRVGLLEPQTAENHYMIWYNAATATVLEVYYSEGVMEEADVRALLYSDSYGTDNSARRVNDLVGYYRGDDIDFERQKQSLPVVLKLVDDLDKDELRAEITVPNPSEAVTGGGRLTMTVEELDQFGVPTGAKHEIPLEFDPITGKCEYLLDTLTGVRFSDVFTEITPGANIRVSATLTVDGKLPSVARRACNSLFASRVGNDAAIAGARHLQNLNRDISGVTGIETAKQTKDITIPTGVEFLGIDTRQIDGFKEYNGACMEIHNLRGGSGLFANARNVDIKDVRIVNPRVKSRNNSVGVLASEATNCTIDGCRVYAQSKNADGTVNYDGFEDIGLEGPTTVGGLVGRATGCNIKYCFSALPYITARQSGGAGSAGGLIGYATSCNIECCYSAVDSFIGTGRCGGLIGLGSGGSAVNCYAVGNIYTSYMAYGFAAGNIKVTRSYAAVTYYPPEGSPSIEAAEPFAANAASDCAYLKQGSAETAGSAAACSYEEMESKNIMGEWSPCDAAASHPYSRDLEGNIFPFSVAKDNYGIMPHYGSWPTKSVDNIKLYDTDGGSEVKYIAVPSGQTVTFYARAFNGGSDAMKAVHAQPLKSGSVLGGLGCEYNGAAGSSAVTVSGNSVGVGYVDLTCEETSLRAVIVVYDAEISIAGSHTGNTADTAYSSTKTSGETEIGRLILDRENKTGRFVGKIAINPSRSDIIAVIPQLAASLDENMKLSAAAGDFSSWEALKSGDPAVTENGNIEIGGNILELADGNNPTAATDGDGDDRVLTVGIASSGVAVVSARWAVKETFEAKCEVKVEGVRAMIKGVSASEGGRNLGSDDNYPYRLDIVAEPGNDIDLVFEPRLFSVSLSGVIDSAAASYRWELRRVSDGAVVDTGETKPLDALSGVWRYTLTEHPASETYMVILTYSNSSTGESAVDYTTFSVYRSARQSTERYSQIKFAKAGGGGFLNGGSGTVEQINGNGYADATDLILQSWVDGAGNSQVKWSYYDGGAWKPITGQRGTIPIYENTDGGRRMRATLRWLSDDKEYSGNATGGGVRITGLDANVYDGEFDIRLKAEAVETTKNGSATEAASEITVKVMPKLEITPQTRATTTGTVQRFTSNRTAADGYTVQWSLLNGSELISSGSGDSFDCSNSERGTLSIVTKYGPYVDTASLITISGWPNIESAINWDGPAAGGRNAYMIIEKDTARELEYRWLSGTVFAPRLTSAESPVAADGDGAAIELGSPLSGSTGVNSRVSQGQRLFNVTGVNYGRVSITWNVTNGLASNNTTYDFHVVGMDIKDASGNIVSDGSRNLVLGGTGDAAVLTAECHFPENIADGYTVTWETDGDDLIDLVPNGSTAKVTAKKIAPEGYSAAVKATFTANCGGHEYSYSRYVEVEVPPTRQNMEIEISHCTPSDVSALNSAFGSTLSADSLLAAVDGDGTLTMVRDNHYGCDTMYMKVTASPADINLNEYLCLVGVDDGFYADIDTAVRGNVMYVKLTVKEANRGVKELTLTANIGGAAPKSCKFNIYDSLGVTLYDAGGNVITNKSVVVYENDSVSFTVRAVCAPTIYDANDRDRALNSVSFSMNGPAAQGYRPENYLKLAPSGGSAEITLIDENRKPDYRVVINASDGRQSAGYALVFLPETRTARSAVTGRN